MAEIDDIIMSDKNKYDRYRINDSGFNSIPIKLEAGLEHKNSNISLSPLNVMPSGEIEYFDSEKIQLSKKRKSEEPWTICKRSTCKTKNIDKNQNNDVIIKSIPIQTFVSRRRSAVSTTETAVSPLTKEDELSFAENILCADNDTQLKNSSLASSNSLSELYEYPISHKKPVSCEVHRFDSITYEQSTSSTWKGNNHPSIICHQHQKCHSVPIHTPFQLKTRKLHRKKLFRNHSQNGDSPAFELDTAFLSKRFLPYKFPSYDVSNFDNLVNRFIDTHCHLDFLFQRESFRGTYEEYKIKYSNNFPRCYEGCIAVFCDPLTFEKKQLWEDLLKEDGIWAAFGCHPHNAGNFDSVTENILRETLKHPRVVALGEIGLDYSSRNSCNIEIQHNVFRKQLKLAVEINLPVVIHCRDAHDDCMKILKEEVPLDYHIHRHCFTGEWREAEIWLNTFPNLYLGITGLVTFPSAKEVHEVVKKIPLNRLLLETDAPYFVPRHQTVKDQKWSRPGMALHVAAQIAALRPEVTLEKILHEVRRNTHKLYGC